MPILTIASSKGGVGKTVLAEILVARLAADGCRIAVLDADPNRALSGWLADVYEGPAPIEVVAEADETRVALAMPSLSSGAEILIIDTAGFASLAASAMIGADAVLVPVLPGRADLVEAERTVQRGREPCEGCQARGASPGGCEPRAPGHQFVQTRTQSGRGSAAAPAERDAHRSGGAR